MRYAFGDMFSMVNRGSDDIVCVTTNGTITKSNQLVMGRGNALQAARLFPSLKTKAALMLLKYFKPQTYTPVNLMPNKEKFRRSWKVIVYGFFYSEELPVALFQVKKHFAEYADPGLINFSTAMLKAYALENPTRTIHLPFPGIGFGGLSVEEVEPLLRALPDNVCVWRKAR